MAGALLQRELTARQKSRVQFAVATAADDAGVRELLRETPMRGRVRVTLEREPDYFADARQPGETRQTIIAREGDALVCVGNCAVRSRFVNGTPCRVGYLGGLRLAATHAGRADVLRRGYAFFHTLQTRNPADYYFTSIAADNARARKFLESALPGMPRYEFIGEFVALFIRAGHRSQSVGKSQNIPAFGELATRINESNRNHQFSPRWTADNLAALECLGLTHGDFCCACGGGAALWDQRSYKQTVVHGYSTALASGRPLVNLFSYLRRQPRLPAVGETLRSAVVSHLFIEPDQPDVLSALINQLRNIAAKRGLELLTLGFDARDPRLATVRGAFGGREYRTRIYVVQWPDLGRSASQLDGRSAAPELALL